ncbi:hypothetical protein B7463_g10985, partial [Scytalidium lignicola]
MELLSSPSRCKFDSFQRGVSRVLDEGHLATVERDLVIQRIEGFLNKRSSSRKRVQKGGELTSEYAQTLKQEKERKQAEKEANKEARMLRKIVNQERKDQKAAWVVWRKKESLRKKAIKQLPRGVVGEPILYKEHTPPPFSEPGKEPIDVKPIPSTVTSTEIPLVIPVKLPVQHTIRTNFEKPELQQEPSKVEVEVEEQEDESEEDFIRLDLDGKFSYSSTSSESENSLDFNSSDEEDYCVL